jgi:catechol 2,3-dioxygenase-like lactoylglutathione lyase family enzyme
MDIRGMTPLLQVFDMARSLRFYRDVLGFEIVQTDTNTTAPNHNWVWLRLNDIDLPRQGGDRNEVRLGGESCRWRQVDQLK